MEQIDVKKINEIDYFLEVVSKDKQIDLTNFNNHLKTLKIYRLSNEERNEENVNVGDAAYDYLENKMYLSEESYDVKSIYHELFHIASSKRKGNDIYTGFLIDHRDSETEEGRGLNEGYTELLVERYFNTATQYHFERILVKQLEKIVGEDFLKQNYFNPSLNVVIDRLSQYSSKEKAIQFIYALDHYSGWMSMIYDEVTSEEVQEALDQCCNYLIRSYITKLQLECDAEEIIYYFDDFINGFGLGTLVNHYNNYGEISMLKSLKKVSEESGFFSVEVDEEKTI